MRRRPTGLSAAVAIALASAAATPADAAVHRIVCATRVTLVETPRGLPVATVTRGSSVAVLLRDATGRWVRVRTSFGSRGWMPARQLCRPGEEA